MPERPLFYMYLKDNIVFYNMMIDKKKQQIEEKLSELVERIAPERDFINKKTSIMSGGQKQLVNVLLGLVSESSFLFCDEISVNLDFFFSEVPCAV